MVGNGMRGGERAEERESGRKWKGGLTRPSQNLDTPPSIVGPRPPAVQCGQLVGAV